MIRRSVARRYVRAGFDAATKAGVGDVAQRQFGAIQAAMRAGPDLPRLLKHPGMPLGRKLEALGEVVGERLAEPVAELVGLVVQNHRVEVLASAGELFQELADEAAGIVPAQVMAPMPLSDEQAQRLKQALSQLVGSSVRLEFRRQSDLIGGIVVRVGDRVIDASVAGRLQRITERLGAP